MPPATPVYGAGSDRQQPRPEMRLGRRRQCHRGGHVSTISASRIRWGMPPHPRYWQGQDWARVIVGGGLRPAFSSFNYRYRVDFRYADRPSLLGDAARPAARSLVLVAPESSKPPRAQPTGNDRRGNNSVVTACPPNRRSCQPGLFARLAVTRHGVTGSACTATATQHPSASRREAAKKDQPNN